jgi:hypothetical protein
MPSNGSTDPTVADAAAAPGAVTAPQPIRGLP